MSQQSQEEIQIVTGWWVKHLAPEGFLNTDDNGTRIGEEFARRGVIVTFENLTEIVRALGDKANGGALDYAPKITKPVEPVVEKTTWKAPRRPSNVADIGADHREFAEAIEDINSPVFARLQEESREEFEKICQGYQASTPMGKADHAVTSERRALLRAIKVIDKRRNAKGQEVILYSAMLWRANEMLREFEKEDIQRNQQRW